MAAAAEQFSEHALGRAVVTAAGERGIAMVDAHEFRALPGRGVTATVGGRVVEVLSPAAYSGGPLPTLAEIESSGATAAVVVVDGEPVGILGFQDRRPRRRRRCGAPHRRIDLALARPAHGRQRPSGRAACGRGWHRRRSGGLAA